MVGILGNLGYTSGGWIELERQPLLAMNSMYSHHKAAYQVNNHFMYSCNYVQALLDKAEAHKSTNDVDLSLDGASDDRCMSNFGRCIGKLSYVSSLPRMKEEDIGSRGRSMALSACSFTKRGMGYVSAVDTSTWKYVNSLKLQDSISAPLISRDERIVLRYVKN